MNGAPRGSSSIGLYVAAARIGVGIGFVSPLAWFVIRYWWAYRTTDGLVVVLAQGVIAGVAEAVEYTLTHPVESLLYSAGMYLLWIFAFGRAHRRRRH